MSVSAAASHKYPGFISYSHRDKAVADRLHRAIERYRVPARLVGSRGSHGPVPKRLYPIFRDRDELAAGSLGAQLHEAIAQSRCFVLVCSPAAAQSRWVNEEVAHFLKVGDPSRLLCLIADGEPNAADPARECFPPAIREAGLEPMAAELHRDADGEANARLKIIAGLLGVGFEELRRRDLAARNRRLIAIAATSLGVAAVTIVLAIQALRARDEAERSRQQGEELIGFMLGDLRGKLEPLGKLDILDAVGDKAMAYFAGLDGDRDPGARALAARAKALRQIGEVRYAQGRPADALDTLGVALKLQRDLVAQRPDDLAQRFELGQTEFWVGYAAWRAGDYERAERNMLEYRRVSEQLVAQEPANVTWQIEVIYAINNLGVLAYERKRFDEALPLFAQVTAAVRTLLDTPGAIAPSVQAELLGTLAWNGSALSDIGRRDEARQVFDEYARRMRALISAHPDDRRMQARYAESLSTYGLVQLASGRPEAALAIADEGRRLTEMLIATDPDNLDLRAFLAYHQLVEASARYQQGDWTVARRRLRETDEALMAMLRKDPSRILIRISLVPVWNLSSTLAWRDGDAAALDRLVDAALAVAADVPADEGPGSLVRASAAVLALERARFDRHDEDASRRHRAAADAALQRVVDDRRGGDQLAGRLRGLLALIDGADRIPESALPGSAAPWAGQVVDFVERRCRPVADARLACASLLAQLAAVRAARAPAAETSAGPR